MRGPQSLMVEREAGDITPALRYLEQKWLRVQEALRSRAMLHAQGGHSTEVLKKVDGEIRHALFMLDCASEVMRDSIQPKTTKEIIQ